MPRRGDKVPFGHLGSKALRPGICASGGRYIHHCPSVLKPRRAMGLFGERTPFRDLYNAAETPEDLPWHREEPWPMLQRVVEADTDENDGQTGDPPRALDLGCGAGEFAVYLARKGYDVTGVDFHETPLEMARARADEAQEALTLVHADVLTWRADRPYDLVLDSGLYHGLSDADRKRYRERLRHRLAAGGNFVLTHFAKKHILDWRPVGPSRRSRETVREEFAPTFEEIDYAEEVLRGVPLPVGPRPLVGQYWFRWAAA